MKNIHYVQGKWTDSPNKVKEPGHLGLTLGTVPPSRSVNDKWREAYIAKIKPYGYPIEYYPFEEYIDDKTQGLFNRTLNQRATDLFTKDEGFKPTTITYIPKNPKDKECITFMKSMNSMVKQVCGAQEIFNKRVHDDIKYMSGQIWSKGVLSRHKGKTMIFRRYGSGDNAGWLIGPKTLNWYRRFKMWISKSTYDELQRRLSELERINSKLEGILGIEMDGYYSRENMLGQIREVRHHLSMLLRKHKLCVSTTPKRTILVKCKS